MCVLCAIQMIAEVVLSHGLSAYTKNDCVPLERESLFFVMFLKFGI